MRTPRIGDVYLLTKGIRITPNVGYAKGGTITLLCRVKSRSATGSQFMWRGIDQFGIGEWWNIEEFLKDGTLRLMCGIGSESET